MIVSADAFPHRIVIAGTGNVGSALLAQLADYIGQQRRGGMTLSVVAVANSRGFVLDPDGFDAEDLRRWSEDRGEFDVPASRIGYGPLCHLLTTVQLKLGGGSFTFVDVTSSDEAEMFHLEALRRHSAVVTANKKPVTASMRTWRELMSYGPRRYRCEATCGAGLPVISTLRDLIASGDRILNMAAVPSGSLGFILSGLDDGGATPAKVAELVLEAGKHGFTEPDPRDDLSCMDVARKALVLARLAGHELELDDIRVDSLVSEEVAAASREDFLAMLERGEGVELLADKVQAIHGRGNVARCVAMITREDVTVGLEGYDCDSHLGLLYGPENAFFIQTERYSDPPLSVCGPGAGAEVTAAGVLADILKIVH